ncbi:hypothetical protein C8J56DRAFT_901889 [Mycena floridula]|nr:hypothetical protein C8J56DRAFT_901889 [Mycena floridula]
MAAMLTFCWLFLCSLFSATATLYSGPTGTSTVIYSLVAIYLWLACFKAGSLTPDGYEKPTLLTAMFSGISCLAFNVLDLLTGPSFSNSCTKPQLYKPSLSFYLSLLLNLDTMSLGASGMARMASVKTCYGLHDLSLEE